MVEWVSRDFWLPCCHQQLWHGKTPIWGLADMSAASARDTWRFWEWVSHSWLSVVGFKKEPPKGKWSNLTSFSIFQMGEGKNQSATVDRDVIGWSSPLFFAYIGKFSSDFVLLKVKKVFFWHRRLNICLLWSFLVFFCIYPCQIRREFLADIFTNLSTKLVQNHEEVKIVNVCQSIIWNDQNGISRDKHLVLCEFGIELSLPGNFHTRPQLDPLVGGHQKPSLWASHSKPLDGETFSYGWC